ncbi:hypothetical protein NKH14_33280 [Mesorhizobium sp. M1380]|uniref:hypothetical protein n=1 Tax=Mesorhizobium sp. M1380 TaxID=2957093 RepID=UPI0033383EF1
MSRLPRVGPFVVIAANRLSIGLDHDFAVVLERSPGARKLLVLDSSERLDAPSAVKLNALLEALVARFANGDRSWRIVIISQLTGFEDLLRAVSVTVNWPTVIVPALTNPAIRAALASVPSLAWIANDADVLPLFANLRTLGWVIAAASSFAQGETIALTSAAAIADRLWTRWTAGAARAQLQRLLMRLALRDAAFERSFALSELDSGDLAAFDQRSAELPLLVNTRNRIEFQHDLASDWARYQRFKEIADDVSQWATFATQPLWIGALRLFGQFLLDQPDQAAHGWDKALADLRSTDNVAAIDLLLDALCLDSNLDRHLAERADLFFANDGDLLVRLFHRFLHVATVPSIPDHLAFGDGLRIYLEADMRFPIIARWAPMGRFLRVYGDRVAALGAPIVARVCKAWLSSLPATLGDEPTPMRDVFARVALEAARATQIQSLARRWGGGEDSGKLIYATALSGAGDLPEQVSAFALEMAQRRTLAETTQRRVDELRAADRARFATRHQEPRQRRRAIPAVSISSTEYLPPWPMGPAGRLDHEYRDAVLHANGLALMMRSDPAAAAEVLLACIVDDQPTRDYNHSPLLDDDLGIDSDHASYPTMFWHSPFFSFLQVSPEAALTALKQLIDFAMERWAAGARRAVMIPSISMVLGDGTPRTFLGNSYHFGWSQL